jgi:hypothetical protein
LLKFSAVVDICITGRAVPTPLSLKCRREGLTSLVSVSVPLLVVPEVGRYCTCKEVVSPAGIEIAPPPPEIANSLPEIRICEMFTVSVPIFVKLSVCVPVLPTAIFPKFRVLKLAFRTAPLGAADVLPMQLVRNTLAAMTNKIGTSAKRPGSECLLATSRWVRVRGFISHTV